MKIRIALLSVLGLTIIGVLFGTFFDLELSTAVATDPNNYVLHAISGFGLVIPYLFFSLLGGILFRITLDNKGQKIWLKVLLVVLSFIFFAAGVHFVSADNFTVNGIYRTGIQYTLIAYGNAFVLSSGAFVLGFFGSKRNENSKLWIAILIIAGSIIVSQICGTQILKSIFHRPRFRSIGNGIEFYPWYRPFGDYSSFISDTITKEEFKSFPSGHASVSALMMLYAITIPLMFPKKLGKKLCFPLFFVGFAYFLFIASVRILAAAHYLSDVCFGGLITLVFAIIAYELIKKFKLLEE